MYNSQLINGLTHQEHKTTLTQLTTWGNSSIWKILFKKARDWSLSEEEIQKEFDERSKQVLESHNYDRSRIAAGLTHSLAEAAGVNIDGFYSSEGLHKVGQEIEESAIATLKDQTDGDFNGNSLQEMTQYVIKQMLQQLEEEFEKKSDQEKKEVTSRLLTIIDELPEDEVERIKDELGVNQLSQEAIRQAISTGAFSVAIMSAIQVGGFGSYLFAVQALAAVTGFFGLTLPFGVYTALTSWMAALANPFLMIPAALGFAWFMTSRGNKKIKQSMLPQFVVQISLAAQKDEQKLQESTIASKL
jgi:peroxiredoxin family protein